MTADEGRRKSLSEGPCLCFAHSGAHGYRSRKCVSFRVTVGEGFLAVVGLAHLLV
jgi:hypothetical protein